MPSHPSQAPCTEFLPGRPEASDFQVQNKKRYRSLPKSRKVEPLYLHSHKPNQSLPAEGENRWKGWFSTILNYGSSWVLLSNFEAWINISHWFQRRSPFLHRSGPKADLTR